MLGRYHTMSDGKRQYISLHIAGDWADAQGLFLDHMDHSICAMETASVYSIPHLELFKLFKERPQLGFVVWRETLIDAAIFRMTITNNSSRHGMARLAHFSPNFIIGRKLSNSSAIVHAHCRSVRRNWAKRWVCPSLP
jgi:CRP-like cAMP-binding protein